MHCSSQKMARYKHVQEICGVKPLRVLKDCPTRWLQTYKEIIQNLSRWPCIIKFYEAETMMKSKKKKEDTHIENFEENSETKKKSGLLKKFISI